MKQFQLTGTSPDGKEGSVWACGACMTTCIDEPTARRCCDFRCNVCGTKTNNYISKCSACRDAEYTAHEERRIAEAPTVAVADYKFEYVCIGDVLK